MRSMMPVVRAMALAAVTLACMLGGIFAAVGLCVVVYGPAILDTAIGRPPDRSHPAFWLLMAVTVPGMLVGAAGALFAVVLPIASRWTVAGFPSAQERSLLRAYLSFVGVPLAEEPTSGGSSAAG